MRYLSLFALAACAASALVAQTTPSTSPAAAPAATANFHRPGTMRPAERPPASVRPSVQARVTTVERVAARGNQPPLTELPDFAVADRDGHAVTAKAMQHPARWFLIYTRENCLPCDRLMNVLGASPNASLKSGQPYVILVAGKGQDALEKVRANFSSLSSATWLSDKDARAFAVLKPRGEPVIYAMDGKKVSWVVPGNLGNPTRVLNMVTAWATSSGPPTAGSPNVAFSATTPAAATSQPASSSAAR